MAVISPPPKLQFFDAAGPLVGGKLYTYRAGTSTPQATFTDSTGLVQNTNPIILDARGECSVWLDSYDTKFVLRDAADALIWTQDHVGENTVTLRADLAATGGAGMVGFLADGDGAVARTLQSKVRESVSVKDFGAKGDGATDDTAAINAAFAYANREAFGWIGGTGAVDFMKVAVNEVYFPPGDYIYNGTAGAGYSSPFIFLAIRGAGRDCTRIQLGAGVVLVSDQGGTGPTAMAFSLSGIHFNGGSGVFNLTSTGINVEGYFVFEDCYFFNYTGTAIGTCYNNTPDWYVRRNIFHSATSGANRVGMGIVTGGSCDGLVIEENDFQENLVHIKLGDGAPVSGFVASWIQKNQFYHWNALPTAAPAADIWLVPSASAPTVLNGGVGVHIDSNKFGNENVLASDFRILIAEELAGTNRFTKLPNLAAVSSGYVGGISVKGNTVFGANGGQAFVFSYTGNLWQCQFDNQFSGANTPTLNFYPGAQTANCAASTTNTIRQQSLNDIGTTTVPVAPVPNVVGVVEDPLSIYQGFDAVQATYTVGQDPGYLDTDASATFIGGWAYSLASPAQIADAVGGNEAVEITTTAAGGGAYVSLVTKKVAEGRVAWLSLDIKKSGTNPLQRIRVYLGDGSSTLVMTRTVNLPNSGWRRINIPIFLSAALATQVLFITNLNADYAAGTNRFQVGRVRLYNAWEPVDPMSRMLDSYAVSWSPGAIANGAQASVNLTIPGVELGDFCIAAFSNTLAGGAIFASATAANTVRVTIQNNSGGIITPTAGTVRVRIIKAV